MARTPASQWPKTSLLQLDLCPRCGGRHAKVEYRRFELGDPQFTHWAYCETTGEPLFLNMAVIAPRRTSKFRMRFVDVDPAAAQFSHGPDGLSAIMGPPQAAGEKCDVEIPPPESDKPGAWQVECLECGNRMTCMVARGATNEPQKVEMICRRV